MSKADYSVAPPNYNISGVVGVSGTPSGTVYEGPWFVEEQSQVLQVTREPKGMFSHANLSLSTCSGAFVAQGSILVAKVFATYSAHKDWSTYYTSSFAQPQKFEFQSLSADYQDVTYGALTASTLGPQATIVTTQPHYRRVPWNDLSGHNEISEICEALTYYAIQPGYTWMTGPLAASTTVDPQPMVNDFPKWYIPTEFRGSFLAQTESFPVAPMNDYWIPGKYATSKENLWQITNFIDIIGSRVTDEKLYQIPAVTHPHTGAITGTEGCPSYRISRHDYS